MIVYSNRLIFAYENGPQAIIDCVASWLSKKEKKRIFAVDLAKEVDIKLESKAKILSRSTRNENDEAIYPFSFCCQYSHPDAGVKGRRWVTEIGIFQAAENTEVECSFLLQVEDKSTKINIPLQTSRPLLIGELIKKCNPVSDQAGLTIKTLNIESAKAFLHEIERSERAHPIVLVSGKTKSGYFISPEKIQSMVIGLANVVAIEKGVDTIELESILGQRYRAWGGAINIIYPASKKNKERECRTDFYHADKLKQILDGGGKIENEVLAAITDYANLHFARLHTSLAKVNHAIFSTRLALSIQNAKKSDATTNFMKLLQQAKAQIQQYEEKIKTLENDLDEERQAYDEKNAEFKMKDAGLLESAKKLNEKINEVVELNSKIASLNYSLESAQSVRQTEGSTGVSAALRTSIAALIADEPNLEQCLRIVGDLYPDRIVVLESAYKASRDSVNFRFAKNALDLLFRLVSGYWEALSDGRGDMHAKSVFGKNEYAQNEGNNLSDEGNARRTFNYRGEKITMLKHLKHGTKDSKGETLRIHFEWRNSEKKIIIGHCGKHLDP